MQDWRSPGCTLTNSPQPQSYTLKSQNLEHLGHIQAIQYFWLLDTFGGGIHGLGMNIKTNYVKASKFTGSQKIITKIENELHQSDELPTKKI